MDCADLQLSCYKLKAFVLQTGRLKVLDYGLGFKITKQGFSLSRQADIKLNIIFLAKYGKLWSLTWQATCRIYPIRAKVQGDKACKIRQ